MSSLGKNSARWCFAASAAALAIAGPAAAQEVASPDASVQEVPTSDADPKSADAGEEIVVTAQKREELLRDVPQSITVVGEETLQRQQATNFQDYVGLIPGLSVESETPGVSRISLRGINTGGVASTVAVYADEVPFGSSSGLANGAILSADFDTFDVARIEVLRGPQGTLYGASSLGGVLKFVTNAPDTREFIGRAHASVESVAHGDPSYSAGGLLNVPLGEMFAIRASGFYRKRGGFIDSIGTAGSDVEEDINDAEIFGGRAAALFRPSDALSIRVSALAQNINVDASSYIESDPVTLRPLYDGLTQSQFVPEFNDIKYRLYNGTVDLDLGFASLLSSTSYGDFEQDLLSDASFVLGPLVSAVFGRPLGLFLDQTTQTQKFTQEVRLVSPSNETFEWLVGLYYTEEDSRIDQDYVAVEAVSEEPTTDLPVLADVFLDSEYQEIAGFANATIHLTPQFEITAGGRLAKNKQDATQSLTGALVGTAVFDDLKSSETVFTYSVAPRYEISDQASVYARIASGYRPGGPNVLPPDAPEGTPLTYDADRLVSYEAGLKADFLDRRLTLDVSAYYLDWKDIQLFAFINDTGVNANGGTARSIGAELTAGYRPMPGLSLLFNAAYVDAKLTQATDPVIGGRDGDQLPYTPRWSGNLSADYDWDVGVGTAFVGGNVRLVGKQSADFTPSFVAVYGRQPHLKAFEVIDLRTGIEGPDERWSVEAFVKNLTNSRGRTSRFGDPGDLPNDAAGTGIIRPRTIGLALTAGF